MAMACVLGCVRMCVRLFIDLCVILLVFTLLPGIPPHIPITTFDPLPQPLPLEGPLAPNHILDTAERILEGRIIGPESIASRNDEEIFVSLHGGKILKIHGPRFDKYDVVASIGPGCDAPWKEEVCGRPLGLRFGNDGKLYVADAYLGLFAVDVDSGHKESLFDINAEIDGFVPKLADDLDIDEEGNIYWSDASIHAGLYKSLMEVLASPSGRLIKFDPKTKTNTVLVKNLHFANGVQLTHDQNAVLVCETMTSRVYRHWIRGPKVGQTEIFVDRLPGLPDNIRPNGKDGYYIALVTSVDGRNRQASGILGNLPFLRKFILRFLYVTRVILEAMAPLDSSRFIERLAYKFLHLGPVSEINLAFSRLPSIVVEASGDGAILGSLQGSSGRLAALSETQRIGKYLFFASPYNEFLGRLLVGEQLMAVDGKGVRMRTEEEEEERRRRKEEERRREEEKRGRERKKEEGKKEEL